MRACCSSSSFPLSRLIKSLPLPAFDANSSFTPRSPALHQCSLNPLSPLSSKPPPNPFSPPAFCRVFASACHDVVILGTETSCDDTAAAMVVSGGVASNKYVRTRLTSIVEQNGLRLMCPPPRLCTDNGVMIAWTGIEHFLVERYDPPPASDPEDAVLDLRPRWPLGEEYLQGKSDARSLKRARAHPSLTSMIQGSTTQQ